MEGAEGEKEGVEGEEEEGEFGGGERGDLERKKEVIGEVGRRKGGR